MEHNSRSHVPHVPSPFHHERLDGSGYPFHHRAEDLTLGTRIMAVADVFTAVTEDRPYREGMPRARVVSILDGEVGEGGLDGHVVSLLKANYDAVDAVRLEEQAACSRRQDRLEGILGSGQLIAR